MKRVVAGKGSGQSRLHFLKAVVLYNMIFF